MTLKILATVLLGPGSALIVGDAIRSARPFVDGFVLIESGGGPDAVDAALAAIEGPTRGGVFPFLWTGDYAAARQFAFERARLCGADYAVTLDPDERLLLDDNLRAKLEAYPTVDVWVAADRDTRYSKERILRCAAPVQWHGRVCENVQAELVRGKLAGLFWELPKDKDAERRRFERGVVETARMIADGDDRFKWRRHRGSCLAGLGRNDEALTEYRIARVMANNPEDRAWVTYLICEQLMLREDFAEARALALDGLGGHAGFLPEFAWILAYWEYLVGDDQNASRWAQLGLHCPEDSTRMSLRGMNAPRGCRDILANLHGPAPAGCVRVHHVNVPLHERISEPLRQALAARVYEADEYRALKPLLRKSDRVLELGSGIGFLACYCAKRLASADQVMTVEADPEMAAVIRGTFEANGVAPTLVLGAVSHAGMPRVLERAEHLWSTKTSAPPVETSPERFGDTVDGVALPALIERHRPTVLIVDIEGGESDLAPTRLDGVRAVLVEVHSEGNDTDVERWLAPQGFTRRDVARRIRLYERTGHGQHV